MRETTHDQRKQALTSGPVLAVLAVGAAAVAAAPALSPALRVVGGLIALAIVLVLLSARQRRRSQIETNSIDDTAHMLSIDAPVESLETPIKIVGVERRAALKMVGFGALGAVPMMAAPRLMDQLVANVITGKTGSATTKTLSLHDQAFQDPALTKDGRIRQWTMIIDLRRCDGCQSQGTAPQCTTSCIEGHFAPEPMEWIEVYEAELPGGGTQFIPTPCQQCEDPPCVKVCPVGATFSTPEGTVLIDQGRCIGCRICMAACPYDRRFFNWGNPPIPPEAAFADYHPDHQTPSIRGTVMKCDFCPDMVRDGTLPFCIQACPNDAIYYGDLEEDIATNGRTIVKATALIDDNNGYRLKEHLGTEPRVFYIPGHGEDVGRDPHTEGRVETEWPWVERAEGAASWSR